MMYKGSTPIDTMYLGGKMVTKVYLGNEKVYPLQGVIPKSIKDAMVLWYDIRKQQATNEGMAATPILRDLSGNGHDATCYNFGWTEESGISTENYPNALVSDGVDDYAKVEGLPLLTKERGFTVLAKRKWISDINSKSQGLASKGTYAKWIDGAFYFEGVEDGGAAPFNRTFATADPRTGVNYIDSFVSGNFTYMTSKKYNSVEFKNVGDGIDTDALAIFRMTTTTNNFYSGIALYSFILFDRDLTSDEIDWVKTNILGEANQ